VFDLPPNAAKLACRRRALRGQVETISTPLIAYSTRRASLALFPLSLAKSTAGKLDWKREPPRRRPGTVERGIEASPEPMLSRPYEVKPKGGGQPEGVVLPLSFTGDDAALVAALKVNHPGAKAALFHRYIRLVERIVTHVLGFDPELSDILQEVFTRALGSIHLLRDPSALQPWLSRLTTLTARRILRSRSRRSWLRRFTDAEEEAQYEPVTAGPDLEHRLALRAVYQLLQALPTDERIAFALRFIDGMELIEISFACKVSVSTVKRRLQRAERRFLAGARRQPVLAEWLEGGSRWQDE
jgi:RNA polymerase sigma-70 factor (ECF subfamily)